MRERGRRRSRDILVELVKVVMERVLQKVEVITASWALGRARERWGGERGRRHQTPNYNYVVYPRALPRPPKVTLPLSGKEAVPCRTHSTRTDRQIGIYLSFYLPVCLSVCLSLLFLPFIYLFVCTHQLFIYQFIYIAGPKPG